VSYIYLLDIDY